MSESMERRLEAERIYQMTYTEGLGEKNEPLNRKKIIYLIFQYLTSIQPSDRFHCTDIPDIIQNNSLESDFRPDKAMMVFERIEIYLTQLIKFPWKMEFYSIREYCGFYQTRIESHLKGCDAIFLLVGYVRAEPGVLRLKHFDANIVLAVAFECLIASIECSILDRLVMKMKHLNVSPSRIVACRMANAGDEISIVKILEQEINRPESKSSQLKELKCDKSSAMWPALHHEYYNQDNRGGTVEHFKNGNQQATWMDGDVRVIQKYIDSEHNAYLDDNCDRSAKDEAYEGTHDDHLQASLLLVNQDDSKSCSHFSQSTTGSDEWSFVRRKLEKDYGTKYFDGSRGDFLKEMSHDLVFSQVDEGIETCTNVLSKGLRPITAPTNRYFTEGLPTLRVKSELKNAISRSSADIGYIPLPKTSTPISSGIQYPPVENYMARCPNTDKQNVTYRQSAVPFPQGTKITDRNFSENSTSGFLERKSSSNSAPIVSKKDYHMPIHTPRSKSVSVESGSWICAFCTVSNHFCDAVCAVCSKSREGISNSHSNGFRKVCGTCTLVNNFDAVCCRACHSKLSEIETII